MTTDSGPGVVELRRYRLHPGRREDLIDVFDREFLDSQEAVGATVLGQFRDLDHPDTFVWLRGFENLATRREALTAFYGGPAWATHKGEANATMVDWNDVLLLRPAAPGTAVTVLPRDGREPAGLFTVTVYTLPPAATAGFVDFYRREAEPALAALGAPGLALLATEPGPNDFPALPVREDAERVVRIARLGVDEAAAVGERRFEDAGWRRIQAEIERRTSGPALELRLRPTAGSRLR